MSDLLPIFIGIFFAFIGILISVIFGMMGLYSKLIEIVKSLTKIEEHTGRISSLEDKMIELRLTLEKGALSSVAVRLEKSEVDLVVKVKNRTPDSAEFEITSKQPLPSMVVMNCILKWKERIPIKKVEHTTYQLTVEMNVTDATVSARCVKIFLNILDEDWFKEKHWEDIFKAEMLE